MKTADIKLYFYVYLLALCTDANQLSKMLSQKDFEKLLMTTFNQCVIDIVQRIRNAMAENLNDLQKADGERQLRHCIPIIA